MEANKVKAYFYQLADSIIQSLDENETLLLNLTAEDSTFIRFNNNAVRQAGNVKQSSLSLQLIQGQQHSSASCELTGEIDGDLDASNKLLHQLRAQIQFLPSDPYLHYAIVVNNSAHICSASLPPL